MSIYLNDIPLKDAWARFVEELSSVGLWERTTIEDVPLDQHAVGRVLAAPIWAKISSPHYHALAMDGFAVQSSATVGALPNRPVTLSCRSTGETVQAQYLDTGDPLPDWADAVIPIENIEPVDDRNQVCDRVRNPYSIRIRSSVPPWSNIRAVGEDMVATQLVLPAGQVLRPVDLGAAAASGHVSLPVTRRPRVAIIPTGSELVPIGKSVRPGEILEYNSIMLASQVDVWGGEATRFPIVADNFDAIRLAILQAAEEYDLILLNAGSSAGSEDYSAQVIQDCGTVFVHGVAVRPGHPVILGMIRYLPGAEPREADHESRTKTQADRQGWVTPIIGVPGFPVSAALTGEIFVEPLLSKWLGRSSAQPSIVEAELTRKITSPAGDDDYLRVVVGRVGDRLLAAPLVRGSGVISSLVRADGIVIVPAGSQGLPAGARVDVRLYRPRADLERTVFAIGSHDLTLDLLAQYLSERERRLASANVGSMGGLVALRRREAHLAGSHLLDPKTGEYNLSYIRETLRGIPVKVVGLVNRQQGLLVRRGNPKKIESITDLTRSDVTMVNRQRGAGTRVLLDYHLERLNISATDLQGYQREEYTHLAVAAAIASGRVDTGLGIAAAANALDLDFVPLFMEPYQLVIPSEFYSSPFLAPLLEVLNVEKFRQEISKLPGYDISPMGEISAELDGTQSVPE